MSTFYSLWHGVGEYLTPTLTSSQLKEKGVITPEEFVAAGDLLVYKCPTWSWAAGDPGKTRSILPKDKQYLVTKGVPCLKRASAMEHNEADDMVVEDEWVATSDTHSGAAGDGEDDDDVAEITTETTATTTTTTTTNDSAAAAEPAAEEPPVAESAESDSDDDYDNIPDIDEFEEDNLVAGDGATLAAGSVAAAPASSAASGGDGDGGEDTILRTRTYDLSITYDKMYQTPRVWLFGYDETGSPLSPEAVFEDISADHANKTVTIETHPHQELPHASIHPCKHAPVMKKILDQLSSTGQDLRADQYLFLFLKFISAVIPTIDYDHTMSVDN